jgi:hypothetical protein
MASLLLSFAVAFGLFFSVARAVGRRWILGVPVLLGTVFFVLLAVNGPGDTALGFLVFWALIMVASAEAGAWVGLDRSGRRS